jgi:hypothetical protein
VGRETEVQECGSHAAAAQARVLCSDCRQHDAEAVAEAEEIPCLETTRLIVFETVHLDTATATVRDRMRDTGRTGLAIQLAKVVDIGRAVQAKQLAILDDNA